MKEQESIRERSGGFLFPRTFADIAAVLPNEEAGLVLKGLICEFWGCGEKTVFDNPITDALYKCILQAAKEIDDNYHALRARQSEGGKRSAEQRRKKSCSAPTESDSAEESSKYVEESSKYVEESSKSLDQNKSKVNKNKENKSKVNESKVSKAAEPPAALPDAPAALLTPPSAALTAQKRKFLIEKYGQEAVETYEQRYDRWRSTKPMCNANADSCISKWMEEDKLPPKAESGFASTIDIGMVERAIIERHRQLTVDN